MQFNQTNNNKGDVNNAFSEKGNVVQANKGGSVGDVTANSTEGGNMVTTSGAGNRVQVDRPKESTLGLVWKGIKATWKWAFGGKG